MIQPKEAPAERERETCPNMWREDDGETAYCLREAGHPGACDWHGDLLDQGPPKGPKGPQPPRTPR